MVGSRAWQHTNDASTIELEDVTAVRRESIGQMIRDAHQPALRDLSPGKLAYLEAMVDDDGPTRVADVERRLGKSPGYQSVYRYRLINDEMIPPPNAVTSSWRCPTFVRHSSNASAARSTTRGPLRPQSPRRAAPERLPTNEATSTAPARRNSAAKTATEG